MTFIHAQETDMPEIMRIINDAKRRLQKSGIDQWQDGYPNEESLGQDISRGDYYLYVREEKLMAVLALVFDGDPNYKVITNGEWLTEDNPYSALHRVAVAEQELGKGVMGQVFKIAEAETLKRGYASLRIDTHPDNKRMQRAIEKAGYTYCGHIYLENGDLRYAYEKVLH